ncbi:MAG: C40 family peptidase [Flavobacterium sp.]|nr:C40 family peptidase [Pedobacter sp.]
MNQIFGVCNLSLVPLRAEPSDRSEMVSQLLFGDHFKILEKKESWILILTSYDDYKGWIDFKQYAEVDFATFEILNKQQTIIGFNIHQAVQNIATGEVLNLVAASYLPAYQNGKFYIGKTFYSTLLPALMPDINLFSSKISEAAYFYLNTPYLWGGRSPFGIDCSGFCQMVFKQFAIKLKRDAWQQAEQGDMVNFLQEAQPGDLAFFDNAEGKIVHVGMMLNNNQIIHASGRVKIDRIDTEGIYSSELKKYTHKLRIIKRYYP